MESERIRSPVLCAAGLAALTFIVTTSSWGGIPDLIFSDDFESGDTSRWAGVLVQNIAVAGRGGASSLFTQFSLQMLATVLPEDASVRSVTWSVIPDTGTAEIDPTGGLLVGRDPGTVTVCASANDGSSVSGCADILVREVCLETLCQPGPGLEVAVTGASVDGDGIAKVDFVVTDAEGVPLDLVGFFTPGAVTTEFVIGWLDESSLQPLQYTAYSTGPDGAATTDSGGFFVELGTRQGTYRYTFGTTVDVDPANAGKTHSVGVHATRAVEGVRYPATAVFHFRPDGAPVTVTREVVQTAACTSCHERLTTHDGARGEVPYCILCHSQQSVDVDTGNTVDFNIMIHKIHQGQRLPSVIAGTPYQLVGSDGTVHDYSTVRFPHGNSTAFDVKDPRICTSCHVGAQGSYWKTRPSRAVCGSCHDDISFVDPPPPGKVLHSEGAQDNDLGCVTCHQPDTGSSPIAVRHASHLQTGPFVDVTIDSIVDTAPGQTPTVEFTALVNGAPWDIFSNPFPSLRFALAGPTTEYVESLQASAQGPGASGTLIAIDPGAGRFAYTFPVSQAVPGGAAGSYSMAVEAYLQDAGGYRKPTANEVSTFAVTDAAAVPRRLIVEQARCNNCHFDSRHHSARRDVGYCAFCHDAGNVNDERTARFEGSSMVAIPSLHLKVLIHAIHRGEELVQPLVIGGFPTPSPANPAGTPIDVRQYRYPGDLRECESCHLPDTYTLPLPPGVRPTSFEVRTCTEDPAVDPDDYCDTWVVADSWTVQPIAAACTSCHDAPATVAHAELETTAAGVESCETCHGRGSDWDVAVVHRLDP